LPATWSSKENVVWRTKLPGPGTSSPTVVGKRIYLTCYLGYGLEPDTGDMNELMRLLVCIDRASGAIVWTKDFKPALPESKYQKGNNSEHGYSSSTPADARAARPAKLGPIGGHRGERGQQDGCQETTWCHGSVPSA
jgi:hypothetical protein